MGLKYTRRRFSRLHVHDFYLGTSDQQMELIPRQPSNTAERIQLQMDASGVEKNLANLLEGMNVSPR